MCISVIIKQNPFHALNKNFLDSGEKNTIIIDNVPSKKETCLKRTFSDPLSVSFSINVYPGSSKCIFNYVKICNIGDIYKIQFCIYFSYNSSKR